MKTKQFLNPNEYVITEWACPKCGERRMDNLKCNGEQVKCYTCNTKYTIDLTPAKQG